MSVLGRRTATVGADDEVEDGDEPGTFRTKFASSAEQSVGVNINSITENGKACPLLAVLTIWIFLFMKRLVACTILL